MSSVWTELPEELLLLIMCHYRRGIEERIAMRPPVVMYYGSGKTFCEVCDRKKKNVAWFRNSFLITRNFSGTLAEYAGYSACPACFHVVPPGHV